MVEVNYKKKYALMPLKEFSGFDKITGEQIISPYAYIVGECYLINEITNNRNNRKYYEVVFVKEANSNYERYPKYFPNGECYNSDIVNKVFDSIEEAICYRNFRNNDLKVSLMMKENIKDIYQIELDFLEKLEYAYKIEDKLLKRDIKKLELKK